MSMTFENNVTNNHGKAVGGKIMRIRYKIERK